jgi:hypothetical protein
MPGSRNLYRGLSLGMEKLLALSGLDWMGRDNMARPRKYNTTEEFEKQVNLYFDSLADSDKPRPPTVAGLACALGFDSRQSLFDYSKDDRFSYVIKTARLRIEQFYEERMAGNSPTGAIFWLKNHAGYTDKQEISGPDKGPIQTYNLTLEEKEKLIADEISRRSNK